MDFSCSARLWLAATLYAAAPVAHAQFTFTNIADSGSEVFSGLGVPSINNRGTVGFQAALDAGGFGVFTSDGGITKTIALTSDPTYSELGYFPSLNAGGTLAFWAGLDSGGHGLFSSDGVTTTAIALSSDPSFRALLRRVSLNSAGTLGFRALLNTASEGLFFGDGATTGTVALSTDPDYLGFADYNYGVVPINGAGRMAYLGFLRAGGAGLFTSDGTTRTTIALTEDPTFSFLDNAPAINDAGTVGFFALLDAGGAGFFTSDGVTTKTIALSASPVFNQFRAGPSINVAGALAFYATLDAGGAGLFIGDGITTTPVVKTGDALFGSTITWLQMETQALNDVGQLAFFYNLADGRNGIAVATPVPEPGSAALLLGSVALLGLRQRWARS